MKGKLIRVWGCDADVNLCPGGYAEYTELINPPTGWLFQRVGGVDLYACTEACARSLASAPLLGWRVSEGDPLPYDAVVRDFDEHYLGGKR
jgi:hypothetical protein